MKEEHSPQNQSAQTHAAKASRYWKHQGMLVATRFNLAWWLFTFLRLSLIPTICFVCTVFILKRSGWFSEEAWWWFLLVIALCGLISFIIARKHFFTLRQALTQLEGAMGLHNSLTVASLGISEWPDPQDKIEDGFSWRHEQILFPASFHAFLLIGASIIPVDPELTTVPQTIKPPVSVAEVETWVEKLEKESIVQDKALEELKEQLEELRAKPKEEWYDHNSLEAGDNLREKTEQGMDALLGALEDTNATLDNLSKDLSSAQQEALHAQLKENLDKLSLGTLPLDEKLLNPLTEFEAKGLKDFSKQDLKELKQQLQSGISKLQGLKQHGQPPGNNGNKQQSQSSPPSSSQPPGTQGQQNQSQGNCSGGSSTDGGMCTMDPKTGKGQGGEQQSGESGGEQGKGQGKEQREGQGEGQGEGMAGDGREETGTGGISRGPGSAPLDLREKPSQLTSPRTEQLSGSKETPEDAGELLGLSGKAPDFIPNPSIETSGPTNAFGSGGEDINSGSYTPEEQQILKRYFTD